MPDFLQPYFQCSNQQIYSSSSSSSCSSFLSPSHSNSPSPSSCDTIPVAVNARYYQGTCQKFNSSIAPNMTRMFLFIYIKVYFILIHFYNYRNLWIFNFRRGIAKYKLCKKSYT